MEDWLDAHRTEIPTPWARVRLHRIDLATVAPEHERCMDLLAADERERAALYRFDADRQRFAVTRAVLRLVLADAGLGPPECLTIVAGPHGKPELAQQAGLRFNVSHSGDLALVAVAEAHEVGVDVEQVRARADLHAVAARFFAPAEAAALAALDGDALTAAFHRCWVRKEACVKATGRGLRTAFDTFVVGVAPAPPGPQDVTLPVAVARVACRFVDVEVGAGYAAALAIVA